ncbi:potassium channel [Purpureocillium lilacinum]|uniref:Potassium channel n=1 Tax=Purpureocillium lilacinum TaxID=33203 RepID=A0A179FJA6_PURLI|nr:potassium channel [Purpureocillium lilacinum]OAQ65604.1 potassium channel [Purpureocillium lilacinum]
MSRRVRFTIAQPITIAGWYISAICLVTLLAVSSGPALKEAEQPQSEFIWAQAFYYAIWATILYFLVASLLVVTYWGAHSGHYSKEFNLTTSQRTLMLQTIIFLAHLLLGALVFSSIEGWSYLDGVYWADVTIFTVGFGDFTVTTNLGRALLFPYALIGIISLGLIIASIRDMLIEHGRVRIQARVQENVRRRMVRTMSRDGKDVVLTPIERDSGRGHAPHSEFERRRLEFRLMRRIQKKVATRRRWGALLTSAFSWLMLLLVGAFIFSRCERSYKNWTYFEAFYFSYVSLLTIGYGDLVPTSNSGRSFFVFWSLLALPSATILISSAGDTVIKFIRDITIRIGHMTILPGDDDFKHSFKGMVHELTCGQVFRRVYTMDRDIESNDQLNDKHTTGPSKRHETRESVRIQHHVYPSVAPSHSSPLHHRHIPNESTTQQHARNLDNLPTGHDFSILLVSEIQVVAKHVREAKSRRYSFDEWAWYLRLIGEDERKPDTHDKPQPDDKGKVGHNHKSNGKMAERESAAGNHSHEPRNENGHERVKWSWVGHQSPTLGEKEESEWILAKLVDRLKDSLWKTKMELEGSATAASGT